MRPGWMDRIEQSKRNIASWPRWMRAAADITEDSINTDYMREAAANLIAEADGIDARRRAHRDPIVVDLWGRVSEAVDDVGRQRKNEDFLAYGRRVVDKLEPILRPFLKA